MAAIVEIKRKIEGIKKLEKITNVMKIIAVSKINKYKQLFLQNSDFNEILYRIISQTIPFCDKEKNQSNSTL
jgi:F0F1-type ATP synthase gamma subunit